MGHQMVSSGQGEKGSEKPTLEEITGPGRLIETQNEGFQKSEGFYNRIGEGLFGGAELLFPPKDESFLTRLLCF